METSKESVGKVISGIGWVYIGLSVIGGLVIMGESSVIGFVAMLVGAMSGTLIIGFGAVIILLNNINTKMNNFGKEASMANEELPDL